MEICGNSAVIIKVKNTVDIITFAKPVDAALPDCRDQDQELLIFERVGKRIWCDATQTQWRKPNSWPTTISTFNLRKKAENKKSPRTAFFCKLSDRWMMCAFFSKQQQLVLRNPTNAYLQFPPRHILVEIPSFKNHVDPKTGETFYVKCAFNGVHKFRCLRSLSPSLLKSWEKMTQNLIEWRALIVLGEDLHILRC